MRHRKHHLIRAICLAVLLSFLAHSPSLATDPLSAICDIWPPYQYMEKGRLVGYSVEMVQSVFKSMDVELAEVQTLPWKRALSTFQETRTDVLFAANYTEQRDLFAHYPDEPLFESPWIIWSREPNRFQSLNELKGKRIGVVRGYSYTREFWVFIKTHCDVQEVITDEANFKKLDAGRVDAVIAELGNGHHLVRQYGLQKITAQPHIVIKKDGLYIIFNRDTISRQFVDTFSRELQWFKESEAHRELRRKYFGE